MSAEPPDASTPTASRRGPKPDKRPTIELRVNDDDLAALNRMHATFFGTEARPEVIGAALLHLAIGAAASLAADALRAAVRGEPTEQMSETEPHAEATE
jgi:hypothetical protein